MSEVKKQYHMMIAFVSPIARFPQLYEYQSVQKDVCFECLQTNEPAICQLQELLKDKGGLDKILLMESELARKPDKKDTPDWQKKMAEYQKETMSAVEFLKAQSIRKYSGLREKFEDIEFSEDAHIEGAMRDIARIAERIRDISSKVKEEANDSAVEITLHADMTGGFRYAAMMMLAIMQLSKYMGIKIGHVIYSELIPRDGEKSRIHIADDIHRMFDLIAGADEFQKYGSVQALEEYFGDTEKYGTAFQELFHAMRRFSDAIRICRTSVIEHEMSELAEKIRHFRDNKGSAIEEEMFAKIIGVIEKEYGSVIINADEPKADRRLDIIAWCVRKKFLQQAMTLCSEWIPGILVEKKICYTEDLWTIRECRKMGKSSMQSWQQQFIIKYGPKEKTNKKFPVGDCEKMIRYILENRAKKFIKELPKEMQPKLITFFSDYEKDYERRHTLNLKKNEVPRIPDLSAKHPLLKKIIHSYFESIDQKKPLSYADLPNRLSKLKESQLLPLFGISAEAAEKYDSQHTGQDDYAAEKKALWERRAKQYRAMLQGEAGSHVMHTDKSIPEALEFLHGYFKIRNERNQSNHAVKDAVQENTALEQSIAAYIKALRNI